MQDTIRMLNAVMGAGKPYWGVYHSTAKAVHMLSFDAANLSKEERATQLKAKFAAAVTDELRDDRAG